jgi:hypothetical protein
VHDHSHLASPEPKPQHSTHVPLVPITKKPFLAYTAFGEALWFEGRDFAANTEDYDFAVAFSGLVEGLLEQGKIKTHPVKLGGWA